VVSQCKNWCLAEGQGNGDQRKAREGLYVFYSVSRRSVSSVITAYDLAPLQCVILVILA